MRNLLEYPITREDINEFLKRKSKEFIESKRIGGLDGVILDGLHDIVADLSDAQIDDWYKFR